MANSKKDFIAKLCFDHFFNVTQQEISPNHEIWKKESVIAFFILNNTTNDEYKVISFGTGTRSLNTHKFSAKSCPLHDCHAEVLAKRGFQSYLHDQIQKIAKSGIEENGLFLKKANHKLELNPIFKIEFFTSKTPCGESSLSQKSDSISESGAKPLSFFNIPKISSNPNTKGILRTKPYRSDTPVEKRSASLSCSDKIMIWNIVGIQGALLSHFMYPIYINQIYVYSECEVESIKQGLLIKKKLPELKIETVLKLEEKLISKSFQVCEPELHIIDANTELKDQRISKYIFLDFNQTSELSLIWNEKTTKTNDSKSKAIEIIMGSSGFKQGSNLKKTENTAIFSKYSKYILFSRFKEVLEYLSTNRGSVLNDLYCKLNNNLEFVFSSGLRKKRSYKTYKWLAIHYTSIKLNIKKAFGEWTSNKNVSEQFV